MFNRKHAELIPEAQLLQFRDTLYDYQREAADAAIERVENAEGSMIGQIILPTGAGKTKIAEYLTARLIKMVNEAEHTPSIFGIACHRLVLANNLLDRIVGTLCGSMLYNRLKFVVVNSGCYEKFSEDFVSKYYPNLRKGDVLKYERDLKGNMMDYADEQRSKGYTVVFIMLYQSLEKVVKYNVQFDFLFCDEAHITVERDIHPNVRKIVKQAGAVFHMTATPSFKSDGLNDMNDKKVYGDLIYGKEPRELVVSKHIVPLNMVLLQTLKKNDEIKNRNQMFATPAAVIDAIQTAAESLFKKVIDNQINAHTPADQMKNGVLFGCVSGNKHLEEILHPTTKAARAFSKWRKENKVDLYLISAEKGGCIDFCDTDTFDETGKDKGWFLENLMKIGKERNNKAIILNIDMLSEGIDLPEINGVIICSAIENPAKLLQIIGRSVRRDNYDRQFIEDVSIKWNDYDKFRKPVSYVYIPTIVNSEDEMESVVKTLEKIYAAYGDLNFTTTAIEYHDGVSTPVVENPNQFCELTEEEKKEGRISKLKHNLLETCLMSLCKSLDVKRAYVSEAIATIFHKAQSTGDVTQLEKAAKLAPHKALDDKDCEVLYTRIVRDDNGEYVVVA